jgi:hypothetical protein
MLKYIFAEIRWGSLSPQQKEKLSTLSLVETLRSPYLEYKYSSPNQTQTLRRFK